MRQRGRTSKREPGAGSGIGRLRIFNDRLPLESVSCRNRIDFNVADPTDSPTTGSLIMRYKTMPLLATLVVVFITPLRAQDPDVLVSTEWLAEHLEDESLVVLHVAMGHDNAPSELIPGARVVDYHAIAVEVDGLPIELPPVDDLVEIFRAAGVSNDDHVVVYGTGSAHLAARVFMTLEYLGHRGRTSMMDGGLETWKLEHRPTVGKATHAYRGTFEPRVRDDVLMSADDVAARIGDAGVTLIDARPENEYTGERVGRNARGGHIPGAYNLYWEDLLISEDQPRLKELTLVQRRFDEAGASKNGIVVNYCQIGMRASYTYLISRHLGYDARFYDGSWADWAPRSELPAVKGVSRQ